MTYMRNINCVPFVKHVKTRMLYKNRNRGYEQLPAAVIKL